MANNNINAPFGFAPIKYMHGGVYVGSCNKYYKAAGTGAMFVGDPVVRAADSTDPAGGPMVTTFSSGAITGVIVAVEYTPELLTQVGYLSSAQAGYVYVCDDPNMHYEVMEGGSGTALAITNVGECINTVTTAGNTVRGQSQMAIDNAALGTGGTWRIEKLAKDVGNGVGAYAKWIVSPSLSTEVNNSVKNLTDV